MMNHQIPAAQHASEQAAYSTTPLACHHIPLQASHLESFSATYAPRGHYIFLQSSGSLSRHAQGWTVQDLDDVLGMHDRGEPG